MSILNVDQISPIGSGSTITVTATETKTGDITIGTGTSIFSPAGNTLVLGTNNSERIRIKNDGKVGIGTNNPTAKLEIKGSDNPLVKIVQDTSGIARLNLESATNDGYQYSGIGIGDGTNDAELMWTTGGFDINVGNAVRLRITSDGNFGFQTTIVAQTDASGTALKPILDLKGTGSIANESGVLQLTRKDHPNQGSCIYNSGDDAGLTMRNTDGNGMGFYNGTILALRVDSNGRFTSLGNKPSANAQMLQNTSSTNPEGLYIRFPNAAPNTSARHFIKCSDNVGDKAVIDSNGNSRNLNNSYGGFSDISLKENIVDASSQLNTIKNIKVREFEWKVNGYHEVGMIAQELHTVIPSAVQEGGDDLSEEPWGVDYSKLTPYLIKAVQEQQEQIDALQSEINILKGE